MGKDGMKRKQVFGIVSGSFILFLFSAVLIAGYKNLRFKQKLKKVQTTTYRYDKAYLTELAHSMNPDARIVHNPEVGRWDKDGTHRFQLKKEWKLGYDDDTKYDLNIDNAGGMRADSHDNLYVYEYGAGKIYCFDSTGTFKFEFGERGQGPGEFSGSIQFYLLHDSLLYTYDYGNQRISKFIIREKKGGIYVSSYRQEIDGRPISFVVNDSQETFLSFYDAKSGFVVHKYNTKGEHVASFGKPIKLDLPNKFMLRMIERNSYRGNLAYYNGSILYSQRNPYKIAIYSDPGQLLLQITRKNNFLKPPDVLIEGKDTYTMRMPPRSTCVRLWNGFIWNAIYLPGITYPESITVLDVYELNGNLLTSIKIPERILVFEISGTGKIYGKLWDDQNEGFLHIVRYAVSVK